MRYQLQTGKTVMITFDQWLNMTDDDIRDLIANNAGMDFENPFVDFNYKENIIEIPEVDIEPIPDEIIDEIQKDLDSE